MRSENERWKTLRSLTASYGKIPMQNILITGATGLIGTALIAHTSNRYTFRALNRRPLSTIECHRADIADYDAILPAFDDIHTVVHLAAHIQNQPDAIFNANLQGTTNVINAALNTGVHRIVFASSGSVMSGYAQLSPYKELLSGDYDALPESWPILTHQSPLRPVGLYAASKVWGEEFGRECASQHQLSVLCLRFGRVNPENRPTQPREYAVWCSHRDAVQAIDKAIAAPADLRFGTFFVNSDNRYGYRDLERGRKLLGYVPEDRAEDHRQEN